MFFLIFRLCDFLIYTRMHVRKNKETQVLAKRSMEIELQKLEENARRASVLLKAMSNQHRLMILCQISNCEKSVGELEEIIGLSQSALSQHLARLRRDNLVQTRRDAQTIYYSLKGLEAQTVIDTLYNLYCANDEQSACA